MTANRATDVSETGDVWHYAVGSERRGPVPRATIAKLLASGEISAETYVWQQGMDNWVHLGDAGPLKALVSGLEGDGLPEDFVEEDTAFTSAESLRASHNYLDTGEGGVSGDTVIETLENVMAAGFGAHLEAKSQAPAPVSSPPPTQRQAVEAAANQRQADAAASQRQHEITAAKERQVAEAAAANMFSSASGSQSASGADIFASSDDSGGSDIFGIGGSSPASEEENIAGVHGRRQSSVLFSLDELGREEGAKKATTTNAKDGFVTDSSGLIDIKAIATNSKPADGDPFSGANLVLPPRSSSSPMSVPIVERRRGAGPWILASAALVVIGGGVIAFVLATGGKDDPNKNPVVVAEKDPGGPGKTEPAKTEPAKTEPAKTAEVAKVEDKKVDPATDPAKVDPAKTDPAKTDPGTQADPNAKAGDAAKTADAAKADAVKVETKPLTAEEKKKLEEKKAADKKAADEKKLADDKKADDKKVADVVPAPGTGTNGKKVEDLLNKLKGTPPTKAEDTKSNEDLPDKLSAAVVRAAIRGKFGRCGAMIQGATGSVTVQTQFVISSSGVVQSARVTDPAGTGGDVQGCVTGAIKDTTFGRFKEATMTVNLPVKLL